mmetsp:Transcript_4473/g.16565  ORF Transcript_4473/g.16565 Transcript_4473/m.16565 type:complete len:213 (+) Transcript_4473:1968-2606(+)
MRLCGRFTCSTARSGTRRKWGARSSSAPCAKRGLLTSKPTQAPPRFCSPRRASPWRSAWRTPSFSARSRTLRRRGTCPSSKPPISSATRLFCARSPTSPFQRTPDRPRPRLRTLRKRRSTKPRLRRSPWQSSWKRRKHPHPRGTRTPRKRWRNPRNPRRRRHAKPSRRRMKHPRRLTAVWRMTTTTPKPPPRLSCLRRMRTSRKKPRTRSRL